MILVSVVVLALLAAPVSFGAEPRTSLTDIEDEVMCPICGTALNLSQAPQAERERELIRRLIAEGRTKQEIKDELVRQYGSEVLAVPSGSGFDLAAWLVPAGGVALAALALALAVRRWRARGRGGGPGEAEPPLTEADAKRVDSDLARYDL